MVTTQRLGSDRAWVRVLILVRISTRRNCLLVEEQPGDVKQNNDDVRGAVRFKTEARAF